MKKSHFTKSRILIFVSVFLISFNSIAQSTSSAMLSTKEIAKWYKNGEWLNGLQLTPHKSINQQEFSRQYHTNKVWWDKAFEFLRMHDLETLEPGSYVIDPGNVMVSVSESPTKEMEEINWETHANFNDLQYIIKGKTKMGITPLNNPRAKVTIPYNSKGDTETYSVVGGKYYDAVPGTFFIFSPEDIHQPASKVEGYDIVKKILIKVRVPK